MNIKPVLVVLVLVVLLATMLTSANIITAKRKFPGQRRLGATNYPFHSFGLNGYSSFPVARLHKKQNQKGSSKRKQPQKSY
ncbi:uncharacterized protein [Cherax quadricarinatus]|uniref:uncharacterized protein isoform X2 n=1 Tax=Cherax quadricarinatus TaxID=27406 RepID=UPI00387E4421